VDIALFAGFRNLGTRDQKRRSYILNIRTIRRLAPAMLANRPKGVTGMRKISIVCFAYGLISMLTSASAQVPLSAYVDANGFIDVQKLTCAQLANTFQEDADMLATWYSGWYNGLAKKHFLDFRKGKEAEHEVIVYCKAHQDKLIIQAISVVLDDMRARLGIEISK
jgi:HdeA/HdeB family